MKLAVLAVSLVHLLFSISYTAGTQHQGKQLNKKFAVVAHRGASGLLPEHTLEAYKLAIEQGADFIECDVVLTRDCQPICRHEPDISQTTDALVRFPERLRNATIDGIVHEGVFAIDFTLQEIRSLRALQPRSYRNQSYNGLFSIPTLQEYIALAQLSGRQPVGIYPETKHPTWHDSRRLTCMEGTTMSGLLLEVLQQHGYGAAIGTSEWLRHPIFIQSFEVDNLRWLHNRTDIPMLQLMDEAHVRTADTNQTYGELMSDSGLAAVAQYAKGIGPWKGTLVPGNGSEPEAVGQHLGSRAHQHGLMVHPYTFRDDASLLGQRWNSQPQLEYEHFLNNEEIDGAFTDFPATLVAVLQARQGPQVQRATNTLGAMSKAALKLALRQTLAEM